MALRDLWLVMVYASFFIVGITSPFVLSLGYLWVDTFYPQAVSPFLGQFQVSFIIGVAAMLGYILLDRREPRFSLHTALTLLFAAWVTLTLTWAERPDSAWNKWDWAFKVVVFAAFLTFVLRSRVQIEAFLQVFLFSAMLHMIAVGSKTFLSGSAYGRQLDVIGGNAGLSESSYLAAVSVSIIPIILYLRNHSILIPKSRLRDIGYFSLVPIAIFAAMGTYARTALAGFLVVGVFMWIQSRRKVIFTLCAAVVVAVVLVRTSDSWNERISTTADIEEDTTNTRVLVWEWTLQYALENPFGGGFQSYEINRIVYPSANGQEPHVEYGRAFHNMYMEVLGEQGFPGLAMYLTLLGLSLWYMRSVVRRTRGKPHLTWAHDLAQTLMTSLLTMMACGCFIGVAFYALVWYLITLPVCLNAYLYRVEQLEAGADKPLPWTAARKPSPGAAGAGAGDALMRAGLVSRPMLVDALFSERPASIAFAVAFGLGYALLLFDSADTAFWTLPTGLLGGVEDIRNTLAGYWWFVQDAWHWPLLAVAQPNWPQGANVELFDVVPVAAIVGKLLHSGFGWEVNPYPAWVMLCVTLNAVALPALVRALGQRSIVGAVLAGAFGAMAPVVQLRLGI